MRERRNEAQREPDPSKGCLDVHRSAGRRRLPACERDPDAIMPRQSRIVANQLSSGEFAALWHTTPIADQHGVDHWTAASGHRRQRAITRIGGFAIDARGYVNIATQVPLAQLRRAAAGQPRSR